MPNELFVQNDNDIFVEGLRTSSNEANYINNATITVTLYDDETGTAIASDVSMTYQSGSNGNYRGLIDASTVTLHAGNKYTAIIESSTHNLRWVKTFTAKDRTA